MNEPNRNSEYDEHLIFVRIVIPAGERLMRKRKKKKEKKTLWTKKRWNEMKMIGYFIIIFVSAARSTHTHSKADKPTTHSRLLKQTKKKTENYLFCSI